MERKKVANYRNFSKFRITGIVSHLNGILTNMPTTGCLTIEERNVLINLRHCINNMLLTHWDNNSKKILNKKE